MKFKILTLFPEMFESFLNSSIIKRAIANNLISVELINIRDYTKDKYHRVDTPPIGGGAGLIMKCQPIYDALQSNITKNSYKIILAPRGYKYDQKKAEMLSKKKEIVILCGHYEGVDERVYKYFDEVISIGDFVLTGEEESFTCNLLEYPQYTEPSEFLGDRVPRILFSGNHTAINKYRKKKSFILTKIYRPDLFANYQLTIKDLELLAEIESGEIPEWEMNAIIKGMKYTKDR